jgi:hypothetical protein
MYQSSCAVGSTESWRGTCDSFVAGRAKAYLSLPSMGYISRLTLGDAAISKHLHQACRDVSRPFSGRLPITVCRDERPGWSLVHYIWVASNGEGFSVQCP